MNAPVTATVPLPPSTGLAPVSVRLAKLVVVGELMFSTAPLTVRLDGSARASKVDARPSVPPVRLIDGTDSAPAAVRLAVPAVTDTLGTLKVPPALSATAPVLLLLRLATLRLPLALTVKDAEPETLTAGSAVAAPLPAIVTLVAAPAESTAIEAAPTGGAVSVRAPAAKAMPLPAATT